MGRKRRVPPIAERARLVKMASEALGFPSGATLAPLLAQHYYWHALARDCVVLCARWLAVQLEQKEFKVSPFLFPLYK